MKEAERIAERAHQIWEADGRPEGRHAEHWAQAKEELRREGVLDEDALSRDYEDDTLSQTPQNTSGPGGQADGRVLSEDEVGATGEPDQAEEGSETSEAP